MDECPEVVVDISHLRSDQAFHYLAPDVLPDLQPGTRVLVPFGKKTVQGWVVGFSTPPPGVGLRQIESVVGGEPDFSPEMLQLARWMADYYLHPLSEMLHLMSPPERPARMVKRPAADGGLTPAGRPGRLVLNAEQATALQEIEAAIRAGDGAARRSAAGDGTGPTLGAGLQEAAASAAGFSLPPGAGSPGEHLTDPTGAAGPPRPCTPFSVRAGRSPGCAPAPGGLPAGTRGAVEGTRAGAGRQFLLHGITGSGKTEVYVRAAMAALALGRQVLYLVPEIALTPQAGAWFRAAFGGQVAVWHSRLARGERYGIWEGIRQGLFNILIGPRSAVFAPFRSLGLIIIDEEQDSSYKQQESPFYHAREVAARRALYHQAALVLGSATPSLESYTEAREGRYRLLRLTRRPLGRHLPRVTIVDLRGERQAQFSLMGRYLTGQIAHRLQRREQAILFLNRRGFSPIVFCPLCGMVLKCERCSISLVYHRVTGDLRCHYCNYRRSLPSSCPGCGVAGSLRFLGTGIQRAENALRHLYPQARVQRLDLDTTRRKGEFDRILDSFGKGQIDILLGTQMVAKGHDFPGVTLVGVLNADLALRLPDFRSAERTYQLLAQVAGRAGRGRVPGEVVVQTYFPDHYSIRAACYASYPAFYREEIVNREFVGYPPFGELIRIRVAGEREQRVIARIEELAGALAEVVAGGHPEGAVTLLGPAPAPVLRLKNLFRWQVMLKGELGGLRGEIRDCIHRFKKNTSVIISVEVDPLDF